MVQAMLSLPPGHGGAAADNVGCAAATGLDYGDECAICSAATMEHARRRRPGTALTALLAHDTMTCGRRTASLSIHSHG
jgi:ribosomal protein S18 acetylase RimI-like enzyme